MSSLIRRIRRGVAHFNGKGELVAGRPYHYLGRGKNVGILHPESKDLLARLAREAKRKEDK